MAVLVESRVAPLPCIISGVIGGGFALAMITHLAALEAATGAHEVLAAGRAIGVAFLAFFALLIAYGLRRPSHRLELDGTTLTIADRHLLVRHRRIDATRLAAARFTEVASADDAANLKVELIDANGRTRFRRWYRPEQAARIRAGLRATLPALALHDQQIA